MTQRSSAISPRASHAPPTYDRCSASPDPHGAVSVSLIAPVDEEGGWGARIRTWDHGTKTRCLTTWPRPRAGAVILPLGRDHQCETGDRATSGHRLPSLRARALCFLLPVEKAVDGRSGAGHVRTKRTQGLELGGERRGREVVGGSCARSAGRCARARTSTGGAPRVESLRSTPLVETRGRRRRSSPCSRRAEGRARRRSPSEASTGVSSEPSPRPELRAAAKEERDVGAEAGCEPVQSASEAAGSRASRSRA